MWENFSPDFFLGESRGPKKKIFCGKSEKKKVRFLR